MNMKRWIFICTLALLSHSYAMAQLTPRSKVQSPWAYIPQIRIDYVDTMGVDLSWNVLINDYHNRVIFVPEDTVGILNLLVNEIADATELTDNETKELRDLILTHLRNPSDCYLNGGCHPYYAPGPWSFYLYQRRISLAVFYSFIKRMNGNDIVKGVSNLLSSFQKEEWEASVEHIYDDTLTVLKQFAGHVSTFFPGEFSVSDEAEVAQKLYHIINKEGVMSPVVINDDGSLSFLSEEGWISRSSIPGSHLGLSAIVPGAPDGPVFLLSFYPYLSVPSQFDSEDPVPSWLYDPPCLCKLDILPCLKAVLSIDQIATYYRFKQAQTEIYILAYHKLEGTFENDDEFLDELEKRIINHTPELRR